MRLPIPSLPRRNRPYRAYREDAIYLVSPAGVPNLGDEVIARAWLDWLAVHHPHRDVWLDCIEPGRAASLFIDTHPRLRTTNTLWQLVHTSPADDLDGHCAHVERVTEELGSPRIDFGLESLRHMRSIHFLGGGYLNSLWPENLPLLAAAATLKKNHGVKVFATGQGFLPLEGAALKKARGYLAHFDYVEARDASGAQATGAAHGSDDAFLSFANKRRFFHHGANLPDVMVLLQGDFITEADEDSLLRDLFAFIDRVAPDGRIGLVEALPPDDARFWGILRARYPDAETFPFARLWHEGFPARDGQSWISTRFHPHMFAAIAGARGVALNVKPGYYDVKHQLVNDAGSGWAPASLDGTPFPDATGSGVLRTQYDSLSRGKAAVARTIYG